MEELGADPVELSAREAFALQLGLIDLERAIERMDIIPDLITIAQQRLPKLTKLTLTDVRGLAYSGESYQGVRRRLFTNPALGAHPPFGHRTIKIVYDVLRMWSRQGTLDSLVTGSHMFSSSAVPADDWCWDLTGASLRQPLSIALWYDEFDWCTLLTSMGDRFRLADLHLDLQNLSNTPPSNPRLCAMLSATQETLCRLSISAELVRTCGQDPYSIGSNRENYYANGVGTNLEILAKTMLPLRFRHLQSLTPTDWLLDIHQLHEFLFAHVDTLRYLHLITCMLVVNDRQYWEVLDFAGWAGGLMRPRGMEAFDLRYRQRAHVYDW